mmetsp:Transcript_23520/g.27250  ORF Transcript_23520/g.27250 Transcript_23520/m.27250 type:complete len:326 (+) Transcript_23520:39-1016(+)
MQPLGPINQTPYTAAYKHETSGMSVRFNPFDKALLAMSCSENFGIVGKGCLLTLKLENNGKMTILARYDEPDAIFDCSWNEEDQKLIALGTGDGSVKLLDTAQNKPIAALNVSKGEIYSVEFSHKLLSYCLATSMKGEVVLVDFKKGATIGEPRFHEGCCYAAIWHPVNESMFASCAVDGLLKIWDIRTNGPPVKHQAHMAEILSIDFNKYEEQIATASIDNSIKIWDLRNMKKPLNVLLGHRYAVRKVKFSPHEGNIVMSASYDMNVNVWDLMDPVKPLKFSHSEHTEFAVGIDYNLYNKRQVASVGWDGRCLVWNWDAKQPKI